MRHALGALLMFALSLAMIRSLFGIGLADPRWWPAAMFALIAAALMYVIWSEV